RVPTTSTSLPYTTLFRSIRFRRRGDESVPLHSRLLARAPGGEEVENVQAVRPGKETDRRSDGIREDGEVGGFECPREHLRSRDRSEEHTSELQSREKLVC